jgi:hypothetical protein
MSGWDDARDPIEKLNIKTRLGFARASPQRHQRDVQSPALYLSRSSDLFHLFDLFDLFHLFYLSCLVLRIHVR